MVEEATINPKALEDAMLKALSSHFPNLKTANNARDEFYDKFQRVADEYDRDFIGKYGGDLDTTLIFAGLFSAVTGAFILDVQSKLEPDYQEMNHTLLRIVASAALGNVPTGADAAFPQWNGPDSTIVHVQTILYSSLAASLLAAFIAMLGKQWLNRYAQVEMRGSVIERSRHRQRKMGGMVTWRFDLVMECLPLMLQAALFLLGYALSEYLYSINKVVASVIIGFTAFGLLFYTLIVSAATLSYNCPFQTPLSQIFRLFVRCYSEQQKRFRKWLQHLFSRKGGQPGQRVGGPRHSPAPAAFDQDHSGHHTELLMPNQSIQPSPFFAKNADWDSYVLDSKCIAWMFEMSTDADFIMAIMKFIPEVIWHAGIRTTPLEKLYDTLVDCFDPSSGRHVVIPKFRKKAYLSARAILHLAIQRKCVGNESDKAVFKSISEKHAIMGSHHYEDDSDLESTLGIIDRVFGKFEPMDWKGFSLTTPHHTWMCRALICHAWDALEKGEQLPDDIERFIRYSTFSKPPPPSIATDCFFLIGCLLGVNLQSDALLVVDRSSQLSTQADGIYKTLRQIFGTPILDNIDHALEALVMIYHLPNVISPSMSYKIFQMVMQPHIPEIHFEKKWEVSRLAMHSAFKDNKPLSCVEDPDNILTFLSHHFNLAIVDSQDQDRPIQNGLYALASTSTTITIETLNHFNPTGHWFVHGICHTLQADRSLELHEAALLFLPLIANRWFHPCTLIMGSTEMSRFCIDWASAVDSLEQKPAIQEAALTVLLGMINSPHWRPHIVPEKWMLLEYFRSIPDDSESLCLCINNPDLIGEIRNVDNPKAMVLWAEILWFKYTELSLEVQEQLVTITKEVSRNERGTYLGTSGSYIDKYLHNMDSELKQEKDAQRAEMLQHTQRVLNSIKQGRSPAGG